MNEEFEALGAPFKDRGQVSDEQLDLLNRLWKDERVSFNGRYYRFKDIAFSPKPFQKPHIPIWVGGEGVRAQRRAATYGDAWVPYFVRITPRELAKRSDNVRHWGREARRNPDDIKLACCLPIEMTSKPVPQEQDYLKGSAEQVADALKKFRDIGVVHVALQFMVPHWPERQAQIEQFAREVMPVLQNE